MNKKQHIQILFIVTMICVIVAKIFQFNKGFDTLFDDGFFLLKLRDAYSGIISGGSQWNLLAVKMFPFYLGGRVELFIAGYILFFIELIILEFTCIRCYGKKDWMTSLCVCLLICICGADLLTYTNLQQFFFVCSFCPILMSFHEKRLWAQYGWLPLSGFFSVLSFFVILPSGLCICFCYLILIVFESISKRKKVHGRVLMFLSGFLLGILCFHLLVADVPSVLTAMKGAATTITQNGRGYDPASFAIAYGLFFRDYLLFILPCLGAYFIVTRLLKKEWIAGILYLVLMGILFYYQKDQKISLAMVISSAVIIPFINNAATNKKRIDSTTLWTLFFFCFPIIASLGTNTYIGTKMLSYIFPWIFLLHEIREYDYPMKKYVLATVVAFILFFQFSQIYNVCKTKEWFVFDRGNEYFAKSKITKKQKEYLDNVLDIMEQFGYITYDSKVLSTNFENGTIYALNADNFRKVFSPLDFCKLNVEEVPAPDFIFLTEYDISVMGEDLQKAPWGWPETYSCFYVGSSESEDCGYDTNRWLYCKQK